MLELREIADVVSGVAVKEAAGGMSRCVRLSDLTELRAGHSPKLMSGEAPSVARAYAIDEGDVIVGARGSLTASYVGDAAIMGAFVSLDLYLVRPNRAMVDPYYLAAFLDLPTTQAAFAASKQGSGLARLPKEALERMEVPLPPMHRQRLIAGLSNAFRSENELLQRLLNLNETTGRETIARAIEAAVQIKFAQGKGSAP